MRKSLTVLVLTALLFIPVNNETTKYLNCKIIKQNYWKKENFSSEVYKAYVELSDTSWALIECYGTKAELMNLKYNKTKHKDFIKIHCLENNKLKLAE